MRIIITGISGFVARHFLAYLSTLPKSFSILGIYNQHQPEFTGSNFSNIVLRIHKLDLLNSGIEQLVAEFKPDWFLHLGSRSSVVHSWHFPGKTIREHVSIFTSIIESLRQPGISCRLLSVGSAEEYGIVSEDALPIREDFCGTPASPYGISRQMQQNLAQLYSKNYQMDIVHTRSFNHVGPYQSSDFVLSSFARQIVKQRNAGKTELQITAGNLNVTRDFTDVRDVVKAYYLLLEKGINGEIYNVCSGKPVALRELINLFENLIKTEIRCTVDASGFHPSENKQVYGSHEKISLATGWLPSIPIQKTLSDLLDFWQVRLS